MLRAHPSALLLAAQLFAVLAYPFFDDSPVGRAFLGVIGIAVLATALWAVNRALTTTWITLALGIPAAGLTILEALFPDTGAVLLVSALFHAPFYFYVSYSFIRYLFHDTTVTVDELFATGAAFTVVAWAFAYLYVAVQVVWPGAFSGSSGPGDHGWFELLFLSFTTLTNTGLSDLTPFVGQARSVVMVEQVAGVLYIALVIARLVGLTTVTRDEAK